jgi:hypothetical protein
VLGVFYFLGVNIDDILNQIKLLNPPTETYLRSKTNTYIDASSVRLSSGKTITKDILDNLVQRFCSQNIDNLQLVNFT